MDKYCKCNFCKAERSFACKWCYDSYENFEPDKDKIVEFSKENDISVTDTLALINM